MIARFGSYYLDCIQEKDAWKICDFVVANEDRLKEFFPQTLSQNLNPNLAEVFVKKKLKQFQLKEEFVFLLKENETNNLVGIIYIKELDWDKKQGEFAYCIGYQFEGKGLTSKAVKLLSEYAINQHSLKTLQIIAHKDNISSVKVAENNHFVWVKTLKNEFTPVNEKPLDMELYELYNEK